MNLDFARHASVAFSVVLVCAFPGLTSARSEHAAADDSARHTNQGVKFAREKQYEKAITDSPKQSSRIQTVRKTTRTARWFTG
jgi:hypothetical protein